MVSTTRSIESRVATLSSLGLSTELIALLALRSPRVLHFPEKEIAERVRWLFDTGGCIIDMHIIIYAYSYTYNDIYLYVYIYLFIFIYIYIYIYI